MKTIETPEDLTIPVPGVVDHGLHTVHDLTGVPSHLWHEVSIERDNADAVEGTAYEVMEDRGYKLVSGYLREGRRYWLYGRRYSLRIAKWAKASG